MASPEVLAVSSELRIEMKNSGPGLEQIGRMAFNFQDMVYLGKQPVFNRGNSSTCPFESCRHIYYASLSVRVPDDSVKSMAFLIIVGEAGLSLHPDICMSLSASV